MFFCKENINIILKNVKLFKSAIFSKLLNRTKTLKLKLSCANFANFLHQLLMITKTLYEIILR